MHIIYCLRIALFQNRPIVKKKSCQIKVISNTKKTLYISKAWLIANYWRFQLFNSLSANPTKCSNTLKHTHNQFVFTIKAKLTTQKMKFSVKDFFSKCDQIRSFLQIWSHLLKKSLMENFTFCAVTIFPAMNSDNNLVLY